MSFSADVIVVGGGPGGGSAAFFLTQAGARVLVLERERLPRYKTCAGGVPVSGLHLFPFSFAPVLEESIVKATFRSGQNQVTQEVPGDCLAMVMRDAFDYYLLQHSGAQIQDGCEVMGVEEWPNRVEVVLASGRHLSAKYVIGADGPLSRVARSVGLRKRTSLGIALEAEVRVPEHILESYAQRILVGFEVLENGYYWIFPKSAHLSVGIGTMSKGLRQLAQILNQSMAGLGLDLSAAPIKAQPLPIYTGHLPLQTKRVLLVGDAAGLVDPLTGEGIRHALESGKLAAEQITSGSVQAYSARVRKAIGQDLLWAARLSSLFYAHQKLAFAYLVRNKKIFQDMMLIISNKMSYKRAMFKLPWYILHWRQRHNLDVSG